jgi:cyclase
MLAKRIIPCLDIKDGRTVKGINFEQIRDAGDPLELAMRYADEGADELVFLDITATHEKRKTLSKLVSSIAREINIPFTVGGGIGSIDDVARLLDAGADKISVNSAAYRDPELISRLAARFGSQCIVLAIDAKFEDKDWFVYLNGGRVLTPSKAVDWAMRGVAAGAGEILLTSMSNDGVQQGFALDLTAAVSTAVNVPLIASGGAGSMQHFADALKIGQADAVLAASVFHSQLIGIAALKSFLSEQGIPVRPATFKKQKL